MLKTGITLTEYIRRRKLSESVKVLKNGTEKIIDIAFRLGYGSPDAFSLAFKRLYEISPSDARFTNAILKPYPRMVFSLSITYIEGEIIVKNINEMIPFVDEQEIFIMPEIRIIGHEIRCKLNDTVNHIPQFCMDFFNNGASDGLDELPRAIPNAWLGWTGDCPGGSDTYSYIMSNACPAGTSVPEGYVYRDLPASFVAKGEFGDSINKVISNFTPQGFITCYTDLGWNAELYLDGEDESPPKKDVKQPFRWLVPCVKLDEA